MYISRVIHVLGYTAERGSKFAEIINLNKTEVQNILMKQIWYKMNREERDIFLVTGEVEVNKKMGFKRENTELWARSMRVDNLDYSWGINSKKSW